MLYSNSKYVFDVVFSFLANRFVYALCSPTKNCFLIYKQNLCENWSLPNPVEKNRFRGSNSLSTAIRKWENFVWKEGVEDKHFWEDLKKKVC